MGAAVTVTRGELTPAQLRAAAGRCEEPDQVRRLLAIALVWKTCRADKRPSSAAWIGKP